MTTTELAKLQDNVIQTILLNLNPIPSNIKKLKKNLWVKIAEKTAPNNLVIRNLCILALTGDIKYWKARPRIQKMIQSISGNCLWKEGYSYWLYTKPILQKFAITFDYTSIISVIKRIDRDFWDTSYERNGQLYPAPFGDVRDEPLEEWLQVYRPDLTQSTGCLWMKREYKNDLIYYEIHPSTVGFNTHCPSVQQKIKIIEGIPYIHKQYGYGWLRYSFYKGYDKKYNSRLDAFKDTFLNSERWRNL